ncbi:MAG: GntR family transcriptional regulator, partial [Saprospiraceae bacterium]|nr:GntR family transcriptional regulator [Saprospiraceae bacterium]
FHKYLGNDRLSVKEGEQVDLIIGFQSDLGYNVIVNQKHEGLIYENEIFQKIRPGQQMKGFVHKIREGNKLDIRLQASGVTAITDNLEKIVHLLKEAGGFLPLHDKSSPEEIYDTVGMSKKLFKKAVGGLYKQQRITLEENGIRLK